MTWLRAMIHAVKVFVIFVLFTSFFYFGLIWVNQEYENFKRYNEPEGKAIKVSTENGQQSMYDRIKLFYRNGE